MIDNKTDLVDPTAESGLSDYEKQVVEEAQKVGQSPESTSAAGSTSNINQYSTGRGEDALSSTAALTGDLNRTVIPGAVDAAESGEPGGDSDVSGGVANLAETTDAPVDQNEYNR